MRRRARSSSIESMLMHPSQLSRPLAGASRTHPVGGSGLQSRLRGGVMRAPHRLDPYRAARAWSRSREESEDLVQETYARVFARPRFLRGEGELGYLLHALRNTLVSQRRAESGRPQTVPLLEDLALGVRASDDPAEAAESRQVVAAIHELPEEFRDALVAVDLLGLSYPEAAQALGVPEGTVASRLFRARDRVADSLGSSSFDQQSAPRSARTRW